MQAAVSAPLPSMRVLLIAAFGIAVATGVRQMSGLFFRPAATELGVSMEFFGPALLVNLAISLCR